MTPIDDPTSRPRPATRQRWFGVIVGLLMVVSLLLAYQNRSGSDSDSASGQTSRIESTNDLASDEEEVDELVQAPSTAVRPTTAPPSSAPPTSTMIVLEAVGSTEATEGGRTLFTTSGTAQSSITTAPTTESTTTTTTAPTTTAATATTSTTALPPTRRPPPSVSLVNGGFDDSDIAPKAHRVAGAIPGWTSDNGEFEIWGSGFLGIEVASGTHLLELNGTKPGTIHQDFATTPGTTIRWSFSHRGRSGKESVEFLLGPASGRQTSIELVTTGGSWKRYQGTYLVPAGQTTTRLTLRSRTAGSTGNLLDGVSVVLEPTR